MSISSDSAEQVMKIMLEGEEICLKATGKAAIEILKYVAVFLKSHQQTQGKTKLINLVKSGKQLDFFGVKKEDLPIFMKEAKRYGILYSALVDKKNKNTEDKNESDNKNGNVDIIVKSEDSSRVNRIVKKCRIATVVDEGELKAEITKAREEKQNAKVPEAKEIGVEQKDIGVKEKEKEELAPVQKEEKQVPLAEKNSQESLLKNSSKTLRKQEGNTNMKKKSVREDLKEIKEELAKENKTSSKSKDLSKNTKQAPNKTNKEKSR